MDKIIISKPSKNHKSYFLYDDDLLDPIINKRFKTIKAALEYTKKHYPDNEITIDWNI
jgi:hypothetical protein